MIKHLLTLLLASLLSLASAAAMAAVDANKATQAELETIKGIGPSVSSRVLEARKSSPFKDWDDLIDRVQGIGAGKAAKLSAEGLTVNGATYAGAAATDKADKQKVDRPAKPATSPETAAKK
ncbi:helix-hairpin-helix domain-containing protein [Aquincola sp. MAHUQ-54]|uniref:Helix-hairpin-helix domain-containing protein n=1 Tax=Aquincola agrisoli TaxID=3119538 RepID=A0AAW9Q909_9BURK